MSAVNSVHQANAQILAQIQQLTQVAAQGEQAQLNHTLKLVQIGQSQRIEATTQSSEQSALDTVV